MNLEFKRDNKNYRLPIWGYILCFLYLNYVYSQGRHTKYANISGSINILELVNKISFGSW